MDTGKMEDTWHLTSTTSAPVLGPRVAGQSGGAPEVRVGWPDTGRVRREAVGAHSNAGRSENAAGARRVHRARPPDETWWFQGLSSMLRTGQSAQR